MIKLVILDFYGVLYSNFNWKAIDSRINSDEGKSQKFAHLKNLSNKGKLTNIEFMKEVAKLAQDKNNKDEPAVTTPPNVNNQLIDYIKHKFPGVKLVLLSNGNRADVVSQLDEWGILKEFDHVFTSSDMEFAKPQIGAYKTVFKAVGVEAGEALIIDDSPNHSAATKSYGFNTIQFTDNENLVEQLAAYK